MSVINDQTAPVPIDRIKEEGESQAFIPYPLVGRNLEHVPIHVRPDVLYYQARMSFLPNAIKLYLHVPWIGEHLFRLNNAIMRDERNGLSEHFKYRLALVASYENDCPYCVSHHACTLERRWGYDDAGIAKVLAEDPPAGDRELAQGPRRDRGEPAQRPPADEREQVALEFVRQASRDPNGVTDELRARLASHFTPQEVMEIVLVMGFWKMYNVMHVAMSLPIEDPVIQYRRWIEHGRQETL